jgi:hypothetical protein
MPVSAKGASLATLSWLDGTPASWEAAALALSTLELADTWASVELCPRVGVVAVRGAIAKTEATTVIKDLAFILIYLS